MEINMTDQLPDRIPPEAPKSLRRAGATIIAVAAILGATSYGLAQIPTIHDNVATSCRSLHVCGPVPPRDIQAFQSGWLPSGSTFASAVKPTLAAYRTANPDWDIEFVQGAEYSRKDFMGTPSYRYEGTFRVTPKWNGFI
jgi:hypothetical protein